MIKGGTGGSSTLTGMIFERTTDLYKMIKSIPEYAKTTKDKIRYNGEDVGFFLRKEKIYKFLKSKGINYNLIISKKLLPDECIYNIKTNTLYIVEKKYQQTNGSTDEKPQTCVFKLWEYNKLAKAFGCNVKFCYLFNDWFKKDEYKDMLQFIKEHGCEYFFNEIKMNWFELEEKHHISSGRYK